MKCGRETENEQVFCDTCLAVMDKYPVKPGIVIHLPRREEAPAKKAAPGRAARPLEEQVARQRKVIRRLRFAVVVWFILFGLAAATVLYLLDRQGSQPEQTLPEAEGRNYHVVATSEK